MVVFVSIVIIKSGAGNKCVMIPIQNNQNEMQECIYVQKLTKWMSVYDA